MAEGDVTEKAQPERYELCIMRHGIAVSRGATGIGDDAKRPLTPEGKRKVQEISEGLLGLGIAIDWIVSSPLVRAAETAGIVADSRAGNVAMDFCDALRPAARPRR